MGKPVARITDMHTCPKIPHVGGPIKSGSGNVYIGGQKVARVGDESNCSCATDVIAEGSSGVFVNNQPIARKDDPTEHGGKIVSGFKSVLIGERGGCASFSANQMEQAMTLIAAYEEGLPFCEVCNKGT